MNNFSGAISLALLDRIGKLEKQMKENIQNLKILLVKTEGHNITFEPPWEFLPGPMVSIMATTGYGIITAILNKDERIISNISYHTSAGNITGTATVENGVVNIPVSTIWHTTQMVFIPVKDDYFIYNSEKDNLFTLLNKIKASENKIDKVESIQNIKAGIYSILDETVIADPVQTLKNKWDTLPNGSFVTIINCGTTYTALVQKISDGDYGSACIISYSLGAPIYVIKILSEWSHGNI